MYDTVLTSKLKHTQWMFSGGVKRYLKNKIILEHSIWRFFKFTELPFSLIRIWVHKNIFKFSRRIPNDHISTIFNNFMSNCNWYLAAIGKRQISYQSMTDKHIHAFISSHVTHCTSGWHLNIHMCVLFTIVFLLLLIQAWWSCDIACCYMYCINMPCEHFFRRNKLVWAF